MSQRVMKGKPHASLKMKPYKKYSTYKLTLEDIHKQELKGRRTYMQKIGKLGDEFVYKLWIR